MKRCAWIASTTAILSTSTARPASHTEETKILQVNCPWCGPRAEIEFTCGGEGGIVRPTATEAMTDAQWGDYVFMRQNPKGMHHEQWRHSSGCGRWFNALRDTVSYRFEAVWKIGAPVPVAATAKVTTGGEK